MENESGKSTLLTYIKTAFYGISKNKNGKQISDFDKYKPWSGEEFSGKIKYIWMMEANMKFLETLIKKC